MQITIVQHEIEDAIRAYVLNQVMIPEDQAISIEMKAGRSEDGFTATINVIKPSNSDNVIEVGQAMSAIEAENVQSSQVRKTPNFGPRTIIPKKAEKAVLSTEPKEESSTAAEVIGETGSEPAQTNQADIVSAPVTGSGTGGLSIGTTVSAEAEPVKAEVETAKAAPVAKTLFSNIGSSAPAPAVAATEAKPAARSLFANLTKPVHDTPTNPA